MTPENSALSDEIMSQANVPVTKSPALQITHRKAITDLNSWASAHNVKEALVRARFIYHDRKVYLKGDGYSPPVKESWFDEHPDELALFLNDFEVEIRAGSKSSKPDEVVALEARLDPVYKAFQAIKAEAKALGYDIVKSDKVNWYFSRTPDKGDSGKGASRSPDQAPTLNTLSGQVAPVNQKTESHASELDHERAPDLADSLDHPNFADFVTASPALDKKTAEFDGPDDVGPGGKNTPVDEAEDEEVNDADGGGKPDVGTE